MLATACFVNHFPILCMRMPPAFLPHYSSLARLATLLFVHFNLTSQAKPDDQLGPYARCER